MCYGNSWVCGVGGLFASKLTLANLNFSAEEDCFSAIYEHYKMFSHITLIATLLYSTAVYTEATQLNLDCNDWAY